MTETDRQADDLPPSNLEEVLNRLSDEAARGDDCLSIGQLMDAVGRRSFAPLLVLAGLIALSPLSGIPGMPTVIGTFVIIVTVQLLIGRHHFWLPEWIRRRKMARTKLEKAIRFLRPPSRWVDRLLRPRLTFLASNCASYGIAVICLLIAITMPPLELLPFMATSAGAAITVFGLALLTHDGVVALFALLLTGGAIWFAATQFV